MNESALLAVIAVVAGVAGGAMAGALTRRLVGGGKPDDSRASLASAAAGFVFWILVAIGVAVAIGVLAPEALDPVPSRILAYLPNVLVAVLLLIVGRAVASVAAAVLGAGLARATGRTRREAALGLRLAIMLVVVLLVLSQLGVNTSILMILFAALCFSVGTSLALLVGLGGRDLAREVAAGRYLRRILVSGGHVESPSQSGRIVALHAATTEFEAERGGTVHVPNALLLGDLIRIQGKSRPERDQPGPGL